MFTLGCFSLCEMRLMLEWLLCFFFRKLLLISIGVPNVRMIPYVDVSLSQKDYDTMEPFLPPLPRGGEGAGTPNTLLISL
jgi:hypothetical protein